VYLNSPRALAPAPHVNQRVGPASGASTIVPVGSTRERGSLAGPPEYPLVALEGARVPELNVFRAHGHKLAAVLGEN